MALIDRYITKRFVTFFMLAVLASMAIFLVVDPIENLDKFLDKDVPWSGILKYYLLYVPYILYLIYPVAVLLGVMFSVGGLTASNEMMAMTASGIPLYRHLIRLLGVGLLLSVFMFWWGESIVPETNRERMQIWRTQVKQRQDWRLTEQGHVYLQDGTNRVLHLDLYQPKNKTGYGVDLYRFSEEGILERTSARSLVWTRDHWELHEVIKRRFVNGHEELTHEKIVKPKLKIIPDDMLELKIEPEEMSMQELRRFAKRIEATGGTAERWHVDIHSKVALPFAGFIIVLFGVPVSAVRRRSGVVFGVTLSLIIAFIYFGFMQVGKVLGYKDLIPPFAAAWLGNAVFLVIGIVLYRKTPR